MKRASTTSRLQRLELLKSRLKSGDPMTVASLADELGVSVRTLNRDIDILREQGVPIEADRGRGGGIRMHWEWNIGRVNFTHAEAVDLLITLAIAQQMKSPFFMSSLESIRRKLVGSFSPAMRTKVNRLKSRVLIAPSASIDVLSGFSWPNKKVADTVSKAFLLQQRIQIKYKAKSNEQTLRVIEPHYLLLSSPVWYIMAWDELRDDIRTFRCDRIVSARVEDSEFKLMPFSQFEAVMHGMPVI